VSTRATFHTYIPHIPGVVQKRGVGATYDVSDVLRIGASWYYNWSKHPLVRPNLEAVPMLWSETQIGGLTGGNSHYLMGFNEPDQPSQANILPEAATLYWRQVEQLYRHKKLVAPAPSQLNPDWLPRFRDSYLCLYDTPPKLDALACHCYFTTPQQAIKHVERYIGWAREWGIAEVWVTEFAFLPELGVTQKLREFCAWMQAEPMVTRYAWFATRMSGHEPWSLGPDSNTGLIDYESGELTDYGEAYSQL
jgi:hypothetical protein